MLLNSGGEKYFPSLGPAENQTKHCTLYIVQCNVRVSIYNLFNVCITQWCVSIFVFQLWNYFIQNSELVLVSITGYGYESIYFRFPNRCGIGFIFVAKLWNYYIHNSEFVLMKVFNSYFRLGVDLIPYLGSQLWNYYIQNSEFVPVFHFWCFIIATHLRVCWTTYFPVSLPPPPLIIFNVKKIDF